METLNKQVLISLLDLAQANVSANVQRLARHLSLPRKTVAKALNDLDRDGLVRADTIRLTFVGLMHASGLRAEGRSAEGRSAEGRSAEDRSAAHRSAELSQENGAAA